MYYSILDTWTSSEGVEWSSRRKSCSRRWRTPSPGPQSCRSCPSRDASTGGRWDYSAAQTADQFMGSTFQRWWARDQYEPAQNWPSLTMIFFVNFSPGQSATSLLTATPWKSSERRTRPRTSGVWPWPRTSFPVPTRRVGYRWLGSSQNPFKQRVETTTHQKNSSR